LPTAHNKNATYCLTFFAGLIFKNCNVIKTFVFQHQIP